MVLSKGQIYFVYLWDKLIISWSIKRLSIFCLETPWIQRYVRKWKERLLEDSTHRHMSTAGWDCSLLTLIKWQRYFCEGISLGKSVWKYGLKQELLEVPVIARSLLQQHFNDYCSKSSMIFCSINYDEKINYSPTMTLIFRVGIHKTS